MRGGKAWLERVKNGNKKLFLFYFKLETLSQSEITPIWFNMFLELTPMFFLYPLFFIQGPEKVGKTNLITRLTKD